MPDYKFLVNDSVLDAELISVDEIGKVQHVNNFGEALNAENAGADAVIWTGENLNELEGLSPIKPAYGWMIVSINIPIYLKVVDLNVLSQISNIRLSGFYIENVELLSELKKKLESLQP
ncbi:hypothetical protein K6119_08640 [Paracrocinitomix mangrovi]|uniref:hypothetical protein n=1 Tax=Paracrocinitomix mangrovi TaxID=2862509 RepID=UPI001C8DBAE2|nr:hypothetical protein [Paracrocinitomix mangrovi]UKN03579.1 hypothetical protein K6119_08640 [Paracrocinitomix mangrovi]